jgi:hypothetical protein
MGESDISSLATSGATVAPTENFSNTVTTDALAKMTTNHAF